MRKKKIKNIPPKEPAPIVGKEYEWLDGMPVKVVRVDCPTWNGYWHCLIETRFAATHETTSDHLGEWPRKKAELPRPRGARKKGAKK